MGIFRCKMCGGTIEFMPGSSVCVCDYCGTKQTLPRLDGGRRENLYDRAEHFRRNNEFDKAAGIYETLLNEDRTDAEAYWLLVLCRYGVEYVEDPATHKRVPTVNRAQYTSIFDDADYRSALQYADAQQRAVYEAEAAAINEIQKGILAVSQNEEPFDVFICYKETDAQGRRTPDSVLAADLYHQLTNEGFKVFFSRITLEDKLGTAYEPYIFAALNSAKVMVVLGTRPEHFNAVWVKNEWSRYLALVKQSDGKKTLIPAYRDMDPYDLPEEFAHLQAQDMSKLGFMQDLIHGIKKLTAKDAPKPAVVKETVVQQGGSGNLSAILNRGYLALEDGEWEKADGFFEQALNYDAQNAHAYLGKLMAELRVRHPKELVNCEKPLEEYNNYQKTLRFCDEKLAAALKGYNAKIKERNETARRTDIYNNAVEALKNAKDEASFQAAYEMFRSISGFQDADAFAEKCEDARKAYIYDSAVQKLKNAKTANELEDIRGQLKKIPEYRDAASLNVSIKRQLAEIDRAKQKKKKRLKRSVIAIAAAAVICAAGYFLSVYFIIPTVKYNNAQRLLEAREYDSAVTVFTSLGDFKDSKDKIKEATYEKACAFFAEGKYDDAVKLLAKLGSYNNADQKIHEVKYAKATELMGNEAFGDAYELFRSIGQYQDSKEKSGYCGYHYAQKLLEEQDYETAITVLKETLSFEGSAELLDRAYMDAAQKCFDDKNYTGAYTYYKQFSGYDQASDFNKECRYQQACQYVKDGQYESAVGVFIMDILDGYKDTEEKKLDAMYQYVVKTTKSGFVFTSSQTVYRYFQTLTENDYKNSKELFDKVYQWKLEVTAFNNDQNDYTTILNSMNKVCSYVHFEAKITGGEPNKFTTMYHTITYPDGRVVKSDWEWENVSLNASPYLGCEWKSGWSISSVGEMTVSIYEKGSDKLVGSCKMNITY